jgi:hypothetical protein
MRGGRLFEEALETATSVACGASPLSERGVVWQARFDFPLRDSFCFLPRSSPVGSGGHSRSIPLFPHNPATDDAPARTNKFTIPKAFRHLPDGVEMYFQDGR